MVNIFYYILILISIPFSYPHLTPFLALSPTTSFQGQVIVDEIMEERCGCGKAWKVRLFPMISSTSYSPGKISG